MAHDTRYDFLNIVAHDLKSPLGAVKGFIDLVERVGPLNDKQEYYASRALDGLDYMEHLINNLLEYARVGSGGKLEMADCDLQAILLETLEMLQSHAIKRSIDMHFDKGGTRAIVKGDKRLLTQVMHNLVSNAVKYNRENGEIWITLERDHESVRISVRDTGIGIAAEHIDRIFEQFYRVPTSAELRIEGSGLGLAIVKTIVERHHGRIYVDSAPNMGSTFTIELPRRWAGSESSEAYDWNISSSEEGAQVAQFSRREDAGERHDGVDDNYQESQHMTEGDSRSDEK